MENKDTPSANQRAVKAGVADGAADTGARARTQPSTTDERQLLPQPGLARTPIVSLAATRNYGLGATVQTQFGGDRAMPFLPQETQFSGAGAQSMAGDGSSVVWTPRPEPSPFLGPMTAPPSYAQSWSQYGPLEQSTPRTPRMSGIARNPRPAFSAPYARGVARFGTPQGRGENTPLGAYAAQEGVNPGAGRATTRRSESGIYTADTYDIGSNGEGDRDVDPTSDTRAEMDDEDSLPPTRPVSQLDTEQGRDTEGLERAHRAARHGPTVEEATLEREGALRQAKSFGKQGAPAPKPDEPKKGGKQVPAKMPRLEPRHNDKNERGTSDLNKAEFQRQMQNVVSQLEGTMANVFKEQVERVRLDQYREREEFAARQAQMEADLLAIQNAHSPTGVVGASGQGQGLDYGTQDLSPPNPEYDEYIRVFTSQQAARSNIMSTGYTPQTYQYTNAPSAQQYTTMAPQPPVFPAPTTSTPAYHGMVPRPQAYARPAQLVQRPQSAPPMEHQFLARPGPPSPTGSVYSIGSSRGSSPRLPPR